MWAITGILFVSTMIAALEVPKLRKQHWNKELWVFSLLLLTGMALSIANSLEWEIPNPLDAIQYLFRPIGEMIRTLSK